MCAVGNTLIIITTNPFIINLFAPSYFLSHRRGVVDAGAAVEPPKSALRTVFFVSIWILNSGTMIMFNKWILSGDGSDDYDGFPFPMFLTAYHMAFATIVTQILSKVKPDLFPSRATVNMTPNTYARTIVPIGVCFAASLVFCNKAYIYLSVAFIQMIKAMTPVAVLMLSFFFELERPSFIYIAIISAISLGVAIASYGELRFNMTGFIYQWMGLACESTRLVLVNVLLSGRGLKLDPLSSLYYIAPVCMVLNATACFLFEYSKIPSGAVAQLGLVVLLLNGLVAFCLNLAVVFLIKNASSLVLTLAGVVKDILIISISMFLFSAPVSFIQAFGYTFAIAGLVLYKRYKSNREYYEQFTFQWAMGGCKPQHKYNKVPPADGADADD